MGGEAAAETTHVVLVSFPGQGHINPLLRLAKRLASEGLLVTFSSTHNAGNRILAASSNAAPATSTPVDGKGRLRFEFFSDGCEYDENNARRQDFDAFMTQLSTVGRMALKDLIVRQAEPVSCVINNPFVPWVVDVADELNIPSAVLWVQSCAVFSTYYHYFHSPSQFGTDASVSLPGLPPLKAEELPSFLLDSNPYKGLTKLILSQFGNIQKARWVLVNTFEELERNAVEAISSLHPVVPIGPLVDETDSIVKADLWTAADCIEWLDAQAPRSVVYVSVGSIVVLGRDEMVEMANGLRSCGRPFLWVVREGCRHLLPERFTEDVKGRGLVVAWSPQDGVLAHGAVACFVTHCGWNSTLELLAAGVPVIAYPQWGDQIPNAKFLVEVYGVGVRLGSPVERRAFAECVAEVTEGPKAEAIREKSFGWKEAAKKTAAEGGSSYRNIRSFVDEVDGI